MEAKDPGIKIGQPWFEFRHLEKEAGLVALPGRNRLPMDNHLWITLTFRKPA